MYVCMYVHVGSIYNLKEGLVLKLLIKCFKYIYILLYVSVCVHCVNAFPYNWRDIFQSSTKCILTFEQEILSNHLWFSLSDTLKIKKHIQNDFIIL